MRFAHSSGFLQNTSAAVGSCPLAGFGGSYSAEPAATIASTTLRSVARCSRPVVQRGRVSSGYQLCGRSELTVDALVVKELAGAGLVGQLQAVGLVEARVGQDEGDPLCSLMSPSLLIRLLAVLTQEGSAASPKQLRWSGRGVREEGRERVERRKGEASW